MKNIKKITLALFVIASAWAVAGENRNEQEVSPVTVQASAETTDIFLGSNHMIFIEELPVASKTEKQNALAAKTTESKTEPKTAP